MNKQKILSISLILVFILSIINLNQISFANITETQNTAKINVLNVEEGVNVKLYQIATTNYNYVTNKPIEGYKWVSSIREWIDNNYPDYSNTDNFYNEIRSNTEEAKEFYDKLTSAIKGGTISISAYASKTADGIAKYPVSEDNLTGSVEFSDVNMGTYLVIIENGYMVYTPSVINLIPIYDETTNEWNLENQNVIIKSTNPTITQTVTNEEKKVDNYNTFDEIIFTIKADIPAYLENSLSKKYCISDKIDSSFTIKEDSIVVYGLKTGNEPEAISDYEISYNTTRPNSSDIVTFSIDFDYSKISSYESIKIVYKANLNPDVIIGMEGNNNYAYLDYSNNPYIVSSVQTQEAGKVSVYSYDIKIKSVDKNDKNITLQGSEFAVKNIEGKYVYFVQNSDGAYYFASPEMEGATTHLPVNEDGILYLYGLDEGYYNIIQTKAPEGYYEASKTYEMYLTDREPNGELDCLYTLIFTNTKGFMLPVTGGKGIGFLVSVGIILVVIGIVQLISIVKKRKLLRKNV